MHRCSLASLVLWPLFMKTSCAPSIGNARILHVQFKSTHLHECWCPEHGIQSKRVNYAPKPISFHTEIIPMGQIANRCTSNFREYGKLECILNPPGGEMPTDSELNCDEMMVWLSNSSSRLDIFSWKMLSEGLFGMEKGSHTWQLLQRLVALGVGSRVKLCYCTSFMETLVLNVTFKCSIMGPSQANTDWERAILGAAFQESRWCWPWHAL